MKQNDLPEFAKCLVVIGELYSKSISDYLTDIYLAALQNFDLIEIKHAFEIHIRDPNGGQFFPKPADLIKIISKCENTANKAWNKVEYAISKFGIYRSVKFDDPLIHTTIVAMGGWIKICSTLLKDKPWLAREFKQQYKELENQPSIEPPKYCCGLLEIMNSNHDYTSEVQVFISNLHLPLDH